MSEILFLVLLDENLPENIISRLTLRQNYTSLYNIDDFLYSFQYGELLNTRPPSRGIIRSS